MKELQIELTYTLNGQPMKFLIEKYRVPNYFILNEENMEILAKKLEAFFRT